MIFSDPEKNHLHFRMEFIDLKQPLHISIRKLRATDDEANQIRQLFQNLSHNTLMNYGRFNEEERSQITEEILRRVKNRQEIAFGAFIEDHLIGYLHFNLFNSFSKKGYQASLGTVIADQHQQKGVGTQLITHGLEEMRRLGYKRIWLTVQTMNAPAIHLYERLGFKREGNFLKDRVIDGKAIDVISMAKLFDYHY